MAGKGSGRKSWMRLAGMGMELGAAVAGLTLFGAWIDRHYGTSPKGLLIGAALGMIGGLYNLIRASMAMIRENQPTIDGETRSAVNDDTGKSTEAGGTESGKS